MEITIYEFCSECREEIDACECDNSSPMIEYKCERCGRSETLMESDLNEDWTCYCEDIAAGQ